jgi:hypothetical protein
VRLLPHCCRAVLQRMVLSRFQPLSAHPYWQVFVCVCECLCVLVRVSIFYHNMDFSLLNLVFPIHLQHIHTQTPTSEMRARCQITPLLIAPRSFFTCVCALACVSGILSWLYTGRRQCTG